MRRARPATRSDSRMKKRPPITVRAHAKVNLDLRVLGVRGRLSRAAHGLSDHRAARHARLRRASGAVHVEVPDAGVPLDDDNLVWKAAAALWTALGRAGEIARHDVIAIDKRIPMQAGLGGGSADAAAALVALARLWGGAPLALVARGRGAHRRRRAVLPLRRHGARPRTRRGDLPAGRSAAALDRDRPPAVRRVDGRSVRLVRRGSGRRRCARCASCRCCRFPGRAALPR